MLSNTRKKIVGDTVVYFNGVDQLRPGDILFVRWKSPDPNGRAKALEVIDIVMSEGVIPDGVIVCSVPRQLGMELMTIQDISNLISDLERTRDMAMNAISGLSTHKDMLS